jgi:putative ABC transport system substrate-binding protein
MQFDPLKRRDFITLLGGAAAWPVVARAQQPAIPIVGYLYVGAPKASASHVEAFRAKA